MLKSKHITKEILVDLYTNKKLTTREIGTLLGVSKTTISNKLKKYNMYIRTTAECLKGKPLPKETVEKMSQSKKGKPSWKKGRTKYNEEGIRKASEKNKGRKCTEDTIQRMRVASTGKNNGMYGKHHSEKSRLQMSLAHQGTKTKPHTVKPKKKIYISKELLINLYTLKKFTSKQVGAIFNVSGDCVINKLRKYNIPVRTIGDYIKGKPSWKKGRTKHNEEGVRKASEKLTGRKLSEEVRERQSMGRKGKNNGMYGRYHSEESKKKMRLSRIKEIEAKYGQIIPNYNLNSQDYFRKFDKENNTTGKFAENGGEFQIKELGYFPDYINFDLKLIIEWDEEAHYNYAGELKEKDIERQKEIQEFYPDFEFRRIKEVR